MSGNTDSHTHVFITVVGRRELLFVIRHVPNLITPVIVTIASRFSLVGADLLVICVTWCRTYETVKISRRHMVGPGKQSFAGTLLRDGT